MSRYLYMLLVFVLVVATAGAQVLCACANPPSPIKAPQAVAEACVGEGDCCQKADAVPVQNEEPCDQCNLKHRGLQTMPDAQSTAPTLALAFDSIPVPTVIATATDIASIEQRLQEDLPPPPLLQDLFSAHALLLI